MVLIVNHFERAIVLLASQFQGQKRDGDLTNLQKLIRAIIQSLQNAEDVNYQLKTERWLSTSIGQQLDEIGVILGLPRQPDESDEDYRERLQFQIFINTANGTPEDAIRTLSFLTNASHIGYFEVYPAFYQMETNGLKFPVPPNQLNDALFSVSPAGVNYTPIVATYNVPISFQFSGDLAVNLLSVNPNLADPSELDNLEIQQNILPNNALLSVSPGNVDENGPDGGLDELNYPLETAGQLSELIQKNGNFPPRRFL